MTANHDRAKIAAWHFALDGKTPSTRRASLRTAAACYRARFDVPLPAPLAVYRSGAAIVVVYPVPVQAALPGVATLPGPLWEVGR